MDFVERPGHSLDVTDDTGPMDKATRRILEGPLAKEVARFGTPLAVGMALQTTFNLADAYIIAQLPPGEVGPAVGALGICDQVAALGTILSYGVTTATAAMLSIAKGAHDKEAVRRIAWQSLLIVLALGAVFGVLGVTASGAVVRGAIGAKGDVADVAERYLRVIVGGSITTFLLLQLTSIQRALGSAKTPMGFLIGGNILNVILAVLLVFGPGPVPAHLAWMTPVAKALGIPKMGMLGAAWATIIARALVLVPTSLTLVRRFGVMVPPPGERGPDGAMLRRIVHLAWPSSAQFVLRISSMLLVNALVARYFTTNADQTATTAMGLVFRLDTMAVFVAMGWGSAAQTFVGQNLGAKQPDRASRSGWITVAYDAVTNVLLIAAVFLLGEQILRIFDDEAAPVGIALSYLHVVAPSYVGLGAAVVLGNAMAGAGATRVTFVVDLVVILIFQVPLSIISVVGFGVGLEALFRCVAATNAFGAVVYGYVYTRGGWKRSLARASSRPGPL
jgi:putative MATE family efflux protein